MANKSSRLMTLILVSFFAISLFCFPAGSVFAQVSHGGKQMGGSVSGKIVDADRAPVSNVLLWAVDTNTRRTSGPVLTDITGRFSFPVLLPGRYDIFIDLTSSTLPGHVVAAFVRVKAKDALNLRITLDKTAKTAGSPKARALVMTGRIGIIIGVTGGVRSAGSGGGGAGSTASADGKDGIDSIHDKLRSPAQ